MKLFSTIVGSRYAEARHQNLPDGYALWLVPEPSNAHSPHAVRVEARFPAFVTKLGYLPDPFAEDIRLASPVPAEWVFDQTQPEITFHLPTEQAQ